jgi:prophage regulatory protein
MSRSWIYDAVGRGLFPAPISLSARAVAWDSVAVAEWQAARMKDSSKSGA